MYYYENDGFLSRLERKLGRFALPNLALYIVIIMGLVYVADYTLIRLERPTLSSYMYFDRFLIMQGQVWRIFTFTFVPENDSVLFVFLTLYFFWFMGSTIENEWGSFRFNLYYLTGYLGSLTSGFIMGYTTNYYLNLSLFLAFAILNSEAKVLLFFFIPIKVKWLALIDLIIIILDFISVSWAMRLAIIFALLNVVLFFWKQLYIRVKNFFRRRKYKRTIEKGYRDLERAERKANKKANKKNQIRVIDVSEEEKNKKNIDDDLFGF